MKRKKKVKFQDTEFYFDDCPICRAAKKAEDENRSLGEKELKNAFKKAKNKGAIVGGPLVDKEKSN